MTVLLILGLVLGAQQCCAPTDVLGFPVPRWRGINCESGGKTAAVQKDRRFEA